VKVPAYYHDPVEVPNGFTVQLKVFVPGEMPINPRMFVSWSALRLAEGVIPVGMDYVVLDFTGAWGRSGASLPVGLLLPRPECCIAGNA